MLEIVDGMGKATYATYACRAEHLSKMIPNFNADSLWPLRARALLLLKVPCDFHCITRGAWAPTGHCPRNIHGYNNHSVRAAGRRLCFGKMMALELKVLHDLFPFFFFFFFVWVDHSKRSWDYGCGCPMFSPQYGLCKC